MVTGVGYSETTNVTSGRPTGKYDMVIGMGYSETTNVTSGRPTGTYDMVTGVGCNETTNVTSEQAKKSNYDNTPLMDLGTDFVSKTQKRSFTHRALKSLVGQELHISADETLEKLVWLYSKGRRD